MNVFISYGDAADQVTALRLQALAAANGLTVYVPPAHTRQGASARIDSVASRKLQEAEVVLAFVGEGISQACKQELDAGAKLGKSMIVMSYPQFAAHLRPYFERNLVVVNPDKPDESERRIVQYLKDVDVQQNAKTVLLALSTLALGLLLLAPADPS